MPKPMRQRVPPGECSDDATTGGEEIERFGLLGTPLHRRRVPHAVEELSTAGLPVQFATNNASRPPSEVGDHLRRLGLAVDDTSVATSSQAAAWVLTRHVAVGARVLAPVAPNSDVLAPALVLSEANGNVVVQPLGKKGTKVATKKKDLRGLAMGLGLKVTVMVGVVGKPGEIADAPEEERVLVVVAADEQVDVDRHAGAETRADRAGAEGSVEGERARLDLGELQRVPVGAAELLAEGAPAIGRLLLAVDVVDDDEAVGEPQGGLEDTAGGIETRRPLLAVLVEDRRGGGVGLLVDFAV